MQFDKKKTYLSINELSSTGSNLNNNAEIRDVTQRLIIRDETGANFITSKDK